LFFFVDCCIFADLFFFFFSFLFIFPSVRFTMLEHEDLAGVPLCVFANKQDQARAMPAGELSAALGLAGITDRQWHMQACCAIDGAGLDAGLEWIADRVASTESAPAATGSAALDSAPQSAARDPEYAVAGAADAAAAAGATI
jgi:hypothetical protein